MSNPLCFVCFQDWQHEVREFRLGGADYSDQNDSATGRVSAAEDKLAEVLIQGQKNPRLGHRDGEHERIADPLLAFSHPVNIVAALAKLLNEKSGDVFVSQQPEQFTPPPETIARVPPLRPHISGRQECLPV